MMCFRVLRQAIGLVAGLLWVTPLPAADRSPEEIARQLCASCHGPALSGARGPNLLDAHWNHGGDDETIARIVREGLLSTGMPPFASVLSASEIDALVSHLRKQAAEFAAGRIKIPALPPETMRRSELYRFRLETLTSDLDTPWGFAFLPDGGVLITEREGRLRLMRDGRLLPAPIRDTPRVFAVQDGGLLDVALHPEHGKNGWIYLAYSEEGRAHDISMTVVVRGRIREGRWVDQQEIFRAAPAHYHPGYVHYGCRFLFDPTGHLFFTIGDRGYPDESQDLASPCGKIHRVADDGRVPADNPFMQRRGAIGSIWSFGHRHPQGLSFHPSSGKLWSTEHGPEGGDELNRIEPGRNYGWPTISNGTDYGANILGTQRAGMESPIVFWTPTIAPSGIGFYTGDGFPKWKNHLFVAGLAGEQLRRIETDADRVVRQEVVLEGLGRVRHVATGPDGLLYVLFNDPGRLARIVPVADEPTK